MYLKNGKFNNLVVKENVENQERFYKIVKNGIQIIVIKIVTVIASASTKKIVNRAKATVSSSMIGINNVRHLVITETAVISREIREILELTQDVPTETVVTSANVLELVLVADTPPESPALVDKNQINIDHKNLIKRS